jgi:hypothetical protein
MIFYLFFGFESMKEMNLSEDPKVVKKNINKTRPMFLS